MQEDSSYRVLERSSPLELFPQKPVFRLEQLPFLKKGRSTHGEPVEISAD